MLQAAARPKAVAGLIEVKVHEEIGFGAVGKQTLRPFFLVQRLRHPPLVTKALCAERLVPEQRIILGEQQIRQAVAGQVDEAQLGIVPIQVGQGLKRLERVPIKLRAALEESRQRAVKFHQIELPVATQVHQPLPAFAQLRSRRRLCHHLDWRKPRQRSLVAVGSLDISGAEIRFVKPAPALLGQNSLQTLTVSSITASLYPNSNGGSELVI